MTDHSVVRGGAASSPSRRTGPLPAGTPGESARHGPPHGGVRDHLEPDLEVADPGAGSPGHGQARRYAHTMRRTGPSPIVPPRISDAIPVMPHASHARPVAPDDRQGEDDEGASTLTMPKLARPRATTAAPPDLEPVSPASKPSDSTAIYRRRRPTLPALTLDPIERPALAAQPTIASATPIDGGDEEPRPGDAPSALPSVMLDQADPAGMARLLVPRLPVPSHLPARFLWPIAIAVMVAIAVALLQFL